MHLGKIAEVALYVTDLKKAEEFYVGILGLEFVEGTLERNLFLRCGDTILILFNPEQTKIDTGVVPTHGTVGQGHLAFAISKSEFDGWEERLLKAGVPIEKRVTWKEGSQSIYFRDPSGNSLEFIWEGYWQKDSN